MKEFDYVFNYLSIYVKSCFVRKAQKSFDKLFNAKHQFFNFYYILQFMNFFINLGQVFKIVHEFAWQSDLMSK